MYGYIYLTTNLINGKGYIGKHKSSKFDCSYKGSGKLIQRAISKYGYENFYTEMLCECFSEEELDSEERFLIEFFSAAEAEDFYNIAKGGKGGWDFIDLSGPNNPNYGKHLSPEVKAKLSASKSGRRLSETHKSRIRDSHLGHKHSRETRSKMSSTRLGTPKSEDHKRKISEFNKGRIAIHKDLEDKRVHPNELDYYLRLGWEKGTSTRYHKRTRGDNE